MSTRMIPSLLALALPLAGCAGEDAAPVGTTEQASLTNDPCASAPADSYVDLPDGSQFGWRWPAPPVIVTSNSGFYGYPWNGRTCLGWVADFEFHPHTNMIWDPDLGWWGYPSSGWAGAWDLPSSGADEIVPTGVDVQREIQTVKYYVRSVDTPDFTYLGSYSILPSGTVGTVPGADGFRIQNPLDGAPDLIYRFVVSVKLRASFQEVRVVLDNPPDH